MTPLIFVTGGVVSSLGKGIAAASLAAVLEARGLRVLAADVDVDSADLERAGAVEREDSALGGFHLRKKNPADGEAEKRNESSDEPVTANH